MDIGSLIQDVAELYEPVAVEKGQRLILAAPECRSQTPGRVSHPISAIKFSRGFIGSTAVVAAGETASASAWSVLHAARIKHADNAPGLRVIFTFESVTGAAANRNRSGRFPLPGFTTPHTTQIPTCNPTLMI